MCWPKKTIPTTTNGQATRLWLCHCQAFQIRTFHCTWIAFWLCFFGWFATANLWPQIQQDLNINQQFNAIAGACCVASTVLFRIAIDWLCGLWGSKKTYILLLIVSAFPIMGMALVQDAVGYIITSFFIGIAGASFVITHNHTTTMFAGKTVNTATSTSEGWGNFGGGCANFLLPLLYIHFVETYDLSNSTAWRICMVVSGLACIAMAFIYYIFTVDEPPQESTGNDLDVKKQTTQQNKEKGAFKVAAGDYRTWILFFVYAGCFGVELTVLRFAAPYFMHSFGLKQEMAGLIVLCFSAMNIFARSLGGIIGDIASRCIHTDNQYIIVASLIGQIRALFVILLFEGICLILFSFGDELVGSLGYTIFFMLMCSLGVQAAEGATFAIVPFVQPKATRQVAGIVGAGGNIGAMIFAFVLFTLVPIRLSYFYAWLIMGIYVICISFSTFGIKFTDGELNAVRDTFLTWTEIEITADQKAQNENIKMSTDKKGTFASVATEEHDA